MSRVEGIEQFAGITAFTRIAFYLLGFFLICGRAKKVFDFDYVWEVYKPVTQRKWGYYTLPILYGDDLVARLDPKLDRSTNTLHILGFWLEEDAPKDAAFVDALANGLSRFASMIGAVKIDLGGVKPPKLLMGLRSNLKRKGYWV